MSRKTLIEEIHNYQASKNKLVPLLLLLGLLGLFLPILPGIAILFLAYAVAFPRHSEKLIITVRRWFHRV